MTDNAVQFVRAEQEAVDAAIAATPAHLASVLEPAAEIMPQHALMGYEIAEWSTQHDGRLTISAPPRVGKSWICMVWAPVWLLAREPSTEIVIACASDSLVVQHGSQIRDIIAAHGPVLGIDIKFGSNRADYVETTEGGKLKLVGIESQLTGFGANYLLIDDAFKGWEDAHSLRIAKKRLNWLQSVALARLYPGGRVLHTGTRWSKWDIHAIADQLGWPGIRLPAICDAPDDPLGRAIGDPLKTPFLPGETRDEGVARWEKIRDGDDGKGGIDPIIWGTMYQGVPTDQQSMLIEEEILSQRIERQLPADVSIVETIVSIDPTTGKGDPSNDTCGIVCAALCDDGRVWILDDATDRYPVEVWAERALQMAADARAGRVLVEANQGGEALRSVLAHVAGNVTWPYGVPPMFEMHHAKGTKWARVAENGLAGQIRADVVRIAGNPVTLLRELRTYTPGDESPGSLDAAAHAVIDLIGRPLDRAMQGTPSGVTVDDY